MIVLIGIVKKNINIGEVKNWVLKNLKKNNILKLDDVEC